MSRRSFAVCASASEIASSLALMTPRWVAKSVRLFRRLSRTARRPLASPGAFGARCRMSSASWCAVMTFPVSSATSRRRRSICGSRASAVALAAWQSARCPAMGSLSSMLFCAACYSVTAWVSSYRSALTLSAALMASAPRASAAWMDAVISSSFASAAAICGAEADRVR